MNDRTRVEVDSHSRLVERFWSHVDQSAGPDECWPWMIGCNPGGYGNFQIRSKGKHYTFQASRWVLGMLRGEPLRWDAEKREEACHHCDNPPCCNPRHLYVGGRSENLGDAWRRGGFDQRVGANAKKTECDQGHPLSGDNLYLDTKRNKRGCRACGAARARRYRAKRRTG